MNCRFVLLVPTRWKKRWTSCGQRTRPSPHRLGFFWFKLPQWKFLARNDEDEVMLVEDGFVYAWSYGRVLL